MINKLKSNYLNQNQSFNSINLKKQSFTEVLCSSMNKVIKQLFKEILRNLMNKLKSSYSQNS